MASRLVLLGIIIGMWVIFALILWGLWAFSQKLNANGQKIIDEPVNDATRTEPLTRGELAVYVICIGIFGYIAFDSIHNGGSPIMAKMIALPPILALFNARKRTGRSLFFLIAMFTCALGMLLTIPLLEDIL
ncbi:MAG: hypothetical protein SPD80_00240 [Atopobium sp.]|uniref:hypothetical protein n=2 Tax=Atopobium sp. TaxID=1872650 RepID=UPI002A82DF0F|nr:hypothetical protein [Atopobium sp.]MDY4522005.1 hypothetical protein [Atopobium sp.]